MYQAVYLDLVIIISGEVCNVDGYKGEGELCEGDNCDDYDDNCDE